MKRLLRYLLYTFVVLFFIAIMDPFGVVYGLINFAFSIVFGWIDFVAQTLPRVQPDAASIVTFLLCFGAFYGLVHFFGGMLYTHITTQRGETKPWRAKWSAAIVSACVLLFAAGMSGVGLFYSTQQVAQSKEPLFTTSRGFRLTVHATQLIDHAQRNDWNAAKLREKANYVAIKCDGQLRFLIIDDKKKPGECAALVAYNFGKPSQSRIYFRNGDFRTIDLRVDDLDRIIAEE